jgi:hypothetical protein
MNQDLDLLISLKTIMCGRSQSSCYRTSIFSYGALNRTGTYMYSTGISNTVVTANCKYKNIKKLNC